MELILLTRRRRVQQAVHLGWLGVWCLGLLVASMVGGAYWLGARQPVVVAAVAPEPAPADSRVERELARSRAQVRDALEAARLDLDALALRVSELQARAIRIDALGERLVDIAGLDSDEFSFGEPPPRGGPAPAGEGEPNSVPDFLEALESLERLLEQRGNELGVLQSSLLSDRVARALRPAGRPVDQGWISSGFGRRNDPLTGQRSMHYGVDFASRRGSPIRAVAGGIVLFAGVRSGLGRVVEVDHGNGYVTRYAHNLKNRVKAGQRVSKGEHIADIGSTGRSTGYHVHFEVLRNGRHVNPMPYVRAGTPRSAAAADADDAPG